jgi:hypothetical protein
VPNWLYLTGLLSQLNAGWADYGVTVQNLPAGAMAAHNDLAVIINQSSEIREETSADPGPPPLPPSHRSPCCSPSTPARRSPARDLGTDSARPGRHGDILRRTGDIKPSHLTQRAAR